MTVPLGDAEVLAESHDAVDVAAEAGEYDAIKGRSPWSIAWRRLRKDKVAMAGAVIVILLLLVAILSRPIEHLFNLDPNLPHNDQFKPGGATIDPTTGLPLGSFGGISHHHLLGVEPQNGRDILARIIEGSWVSLLVASAATALSVIIGVLIGVTAGYYGGWVDTVLSRLMDVVLAFPLLLFAIAISASVQTQNAQTKVHGLSGTPLQIFVIVFIIGFFSWPYIGRIIRGQTLSLREREFVAAAQSLGARGPYILIKELLPNLIAPILVYSTLLIPTNILFEAALDFLGAGISEPQSSWGLELSESVKWYQYDPMFMIIPGAAIFITVLAFNLLGDGLRDAFDPKAGR